MIKVYLKYSLYFIFVVLLQGLVFNNFQISEYLYPMAYVLVVLMIPPQVNLYTTLIISVVLGVSVDALSDTFGLHTSSCLTIAYLRPIILNFIKPRDGYDTNLTLSIQDMGKTWFFMYALIVIGIHHLWFFIFEILKFNQIGHILVKTLFSSFFSFILIILLQYLLFKPSKV